MGEGWIYVVIGIVDKNRRVSYGRKWMLEWDAVYKSKFKFSLG